MFSKSYEVITRRVIERLEAGTVPWSKPWAGEQAMPKNLISRKQYRGLNVFMLACMDFESPWFLTFNQAKKLGGHVKKGSRGCPVIYYSLWEKFEDGTEIKIPVLKHYTVFNVSQCDGIEAPQLDIPEREHSPIEAAEKIVAGMPNAPEIRHGHNQASYLPLLDVVKMPRPEAFESGEAYYATLNHELVHSSGHSSRLDRHLDTKLAAFGSFDYSTEELVAEMGAAFLCGHAGILDSQIELSGAYIGGWLRGLMID